MDVMKVKEVHNNVLFTVSGKGSECRAVQLLDRVGKELYANTTLEKDDLVLVAEIPGFLYGPNMSKPEDAGEAVSHIIIGLVPPSQWHGVKDYFELVKRR